MRDALKIALGIFLGFTGVVLCAVCAFAAVTLGGISLMSAALTPSASLSALSPTQSGRTTTPSALADLQTMNLLFYPLAVDYDPAQWEIAVDDFGFPSLMSLQVSKCTLRDAGVGEVLGEPQGPIDLGQVQYNLYQTTDAAGTYTREYIAVGGFPPPASGGFPFLLLTSSSDGFLPCVNQAHTVLKTLHSIE